MNLNDGILQQAKEDRYFGSVSSETAYREAADNNLEVVLPEKHDLFIDIDDDDAYRRFDKAMGTMIKHFDAIVVKNTPSRSGLPKRHLVVRLNHEVTDAERIALQAALASDPVREILGIVRVQHKDQHPTLFLEEKSGDTGQALSD